MLLLLLLLLARRWLDVPSTEYFSPSGGEMFRKMVKLNLPNYFHHPPLAFASSGDSLIFTPHLGLPRGALRRLLLRSTSLRP
uniref:Putative secreted protein n=1 Tax=Anopheles darlingi TaxID=43151 RepID=A0A2M4DNR0_ANODA